jgi:hypothetical protein
VIVLDDIRDAFTEAVRQTETKSTTIASCENNVLLSAWNRACKPFSRYQWMFESIEWCTVKLGLTGLAMLFATH